MPILKRINKYQGLKDIDVLVEESGLTSKYFNILEVPENIPKGTSSFLLAGSQFLKPNVELIDGVFYTDGAQKFKSSVPTKLMFVVQNTGQSIARDVNLKVSVPENIVSLDGSDGYYVVGNLNPGESKELTYPFIANANFKKENVNLNVVANEKMGKYGSSKTFVLEADQSLDASKLVVQSDVYKKTEISRKYLNSDVDINIPSTKLKKSKTYALIIGNEDYSSFQTGLNSEVDVDFAKNDAEIFKSYCIHVLGIPERQIKLITNGTYGQMNQGLSWLKNMANIETGKAELIFYYSGHGLPDERTKEGYIMPVDISGTNVNDGLALKTVYKSLNQFPTKKITVYLDACFSGGARNEGLIARKGVKIKPKEETIAGNMVVFASSSGNESSGVYREQQHGYFTYFLLKKLQETKGSITYKELADYLEYNVKKETGLSGKIQTPQVNVSSSVADSWGNWSFK